MHRGILYLATEPQFINEAKISAQALRNNMDHPVAVVTRPSYTPSFADRVIHIEEPDDSFADKPQLLGESPFEQTLYLDTDTLVVANVDEIFNVLKKADIAAVHNAKSYGLEGYGPEPDNDVPACLPEYNTGVLAYTSDGMNTFQKKWLSEYQADWDRCGEAPPDQPSFKRAVHRSDVQVATLPSIYNCVFRRPEYLNGEVKILHGRLTNVNSMGASRSVNAEYAAKKLNKHHTPRVYDCKMGVIRLLKLNKVQVAQALARDYGTYYAARTIGDWILRKTGMR